MGRDRALLGFVCLVGCAPSPSTGEAGGDAWISVELPDPIQIRDLTASVVPLSEDEPLTLDYAWSVDGAPTDHHGDRVPASALWPGQEWTVTVTPSSGDRVGAPVSATGSVGEPAGGNVMLVILDDLGVDRFNGFGLAEQQERTPNIDALTAGGVLFTKAYALPLCSASRAALLTGRHARRTGVGALIGGGTGEELSLEAITLPEALRSARAGDYTSAAVGKYHLAAYQSASGYDSPNLQGFDWYAGSNDNLPESPSGYFKWNKVVNGSLEAVERYATSETVDDAIAVIGEMPEPWFLQVAFNAPHHPYHVPPAHLRSIEVTPDSPDPLLYSAMLEAADTELGRLIAAIDPAVLADTTIVLVADNGTARPAVLPPFDPARSKQSVYEGGVHVPLVVAGPLVAQPGSTSDALVHVVDLFATVAEIAGVPVGTHGEALSVYQDDGGARALDGISIVPWLRDPTLPSARETVYTETFTPNGPPPYVAKDDQTVTDGRYKMIRSTSAYFGFSEDQLFDLSTSAFDEGEDLLAQGLDAEQQSAYERLAAALEGHLASMPYEGF